MELEAEVRQFLADNFVLDDGAAHVPIDASLTGTGVIDSVGVLELIMFLEESFGIQVAESEALPENLDSIANIVAYLEAKGARAA